MTAAPLSAAQVMPWTILSVVPVPVLSSTLTGRMRAVPGDPGDPLAVVGRRGDDPGDERAVDVVVRGVEVVVDEVAAAVPMLFFRSGWTEVHSRVEDGHGYGRRADRLLPGRGAP